ncbi:MAG: esterase/lipase family protein [Janthinobacterium lividum]
MNCFRRYALLVPSALTAACLGVAAPSQRASAPAGTPDPIIFVHGNGDDASRWIPTIWLFESNGFPADRLSAIRFHNPVARIDDTLVEEGRSSTTEAMQELSRFVQTTLQRTHARKVVLIGSSRGGLTIRNYVQNGGGAEFVSAEVLCGTPNHGVNVSDKSTGGEFNGGGTFLTALNRLNGKGLEVTPGVRTLTLRSDNLDKYAQPTGIGLGAPAMKTGVTFEGPSLIGAENTVLPGTDHRETAFSNAAFAAMYRFVTGAAPKTLDIKPEAKPTLSGLVTSVNGAAATNDGMGGVRLRIAEVRPGVADHTVYDKTTDASGAWGPVKASSTVELLFDLEANGRHVVYFMPPLTRSTALLNFRFVPSGPTAAKSANATAQSGNFLVSRPDGYFSRERDAVLVNGTQAASEPAGLPLRDAFAVETSDLKPVEVRLRGETILVEPSPDPSAVLTIANFLR